MCNIAARCLEAHCKAHTKTGPESWLLLLHGPRKEPEFPGAASNERAQPLLPLLPETENPL